MSRQLPYIVVALAAGALGHLTASPAGALKIGLPKSLLTNAGAAKFEVMEVNFRAVMKEQTGLDGDLVTIESPDLLCRALADGKVQVGAFRGFEFAWLQPRQPNLEAIMVAARDADALRMVLVTMRSHAAQDVAGLRGQTLAATGDVGPEARMFVDQLCRRAGSKEKDVFAKTLESASQEDALDDVVDGKAQAAAVSLAAFKQFEKRKPGRAARLRLLATSEPFPPAVVAFERGKLDPATVHRFRAGMETAHKTNLGARLMAQIRINRFEAVPADFARRLADLVKAYPAPPHPATP